MSDWSFQLPLFLQTFTCFRVITMDMRNHCASRYRGKSNEDGSTNDTSKDVAIKTLSEDAPANLSHIGIGHNNKAIVIGHSVGGVVAVELAHAHPSLVGGLVLLDPAYLAPTEGFIQLTQQLRDDYTVAIAAFFDAVYSPDTPEHIKTWHKLRAWGADRSSTIGAVEELAKYIGPSGVECAKRTRTNVPRLVGNSMPQFLKVEREAGVDDVRDSLVALEGGHWMMKVRPDALNTLLENWLDENSFLS
ncbi:Alpha/Beta hydrolase protein [Microdochium trichocladiopsis]|uniref:Alpha/Beta hydrolase protein n=1 Tax=Microdochium trichocladiopsis TaxID=1682393 RepID=A0A9P8Y2V3_9PEZI|nr:Alpha/Beta hydrolase protein [Microdochium trichocladiopsis]KAH7028202.1 Alpha/Beta hydrolase protein [Microdochium trichocladiopsis]